VARNRPRRRRAVGRGVRASSDAGRPVRNPPCQSSSISSRSPAEVNNSMGRDGTDTNGNYDFFTDGSGGNNCFKGNDTSTFAPDNSAPGSDGHATIAQLYPTCPVPAGTQPNPGATGGSFGNVNLQILQLLPLVSADPPENQECFWTKHEHPKFKKFEPLNVTPGPDCP